MCDAHTTHLLLSTVHDSSTPQNLDIEGDAGGYAGASGIGTVIVGRGAGHDGTVVVVVAWAVARD